MTAIHSSLIGCKTWTVQEYSNDRVAKLRRSKTPEKSSDVLDGADSKSLLPSVQTFIKQKKGAASALPQLQLCTTEQIGDSAFKHNDKPYLGQDANSQARSKLWF